MELDCITVSRLLLVPVVNVCESIKNWFWLIYPKLSWLQYCVLLPFVWLRIILREWFVTSFNSTHTCPATSEFCTDFRWWFRSIILSRISALFPGDQIFLSENTWKNSHIIFIQWKWFKIWNNFGKRFASEGVEAAYIARTIFIFYSYLKSSVWLLLVTVTLPITGASCEGSFSKLKLLKIFRIISMTSERLGNVDRPSVERVRAEKIDLDDFVDEFDSRHDNRRIKLHWVGNYMI